MTLAKRIIPCLDVTAGRVVKGTNFVDLRDGRGGRGRAEFGKQAGGVFGAEFRDQGGAGLVFGAQVVVLP